MKRRVLFLCTHNSARSQMAEGFLRALDGDRSEVFSAGTEVTRVHPLAIEAMREAGIDISSHRSKSLDELRGQPFDLLITVCDSAKESCPILPGVREKLHWSFEDPSTGDIETFRRVRDEIRARVARLVG